MTGKLTRAISQQALNAATVQDQHEVIANAISCIAQLEDQLQESLAVLKDLLREPNWPENAVKARRIIARVEGGQS